MNLGTLKFKFVRKYGKQFFKKTKNYQFGKNLWSRDFTKRMILKPFSMFKIARAKEPYLHKHRRHEIIFS